MAAAEAAAAAAAAAELEAAEKAAAEAAKAELAAVKAEKAKFLIGAKLTIQETSTGRVAPVTHPLGTRLALLAAEAAEPDSMVSAIRVGTA